MKHCSKCKLEKSVEEFYKHNGYKDGLQSRCKLCTNQAGSQSRKKHPERHRETMRRWRDKNADTQRAYEQNRKAKEINLPGSFTPQEWIDLCNFFDNRCVCCGKRKPLEADHVIPVTWEDSSNYISNIQPLCRSCNAAKKNFHAADYRPAAYCNLYL